MKLSDYSLNAYKKTSSENNARTSDKGSVAAQLLNQELQAEKKTVKTPVFQKLTRNPVSEEILPQKIPPQEKVPQEIALSQGGLLKVPLSPKTSDGRDSVYRRVAKFLMIIGVDEAAKVMQHLTPDQTEKIIPELATLQSVNQEEAAEILEEFKSLISKAREDGGVDTARNILKKAFGSEKADALIDKAVPFKNGKPFEYLAEADSEKITALLKEESGAVRALVCSNLKPKVAAGFIQNLPEEEKKEVILRLAKLKDMDPVIIARVDEAMQKKFNSLVTHKTDEMDGKNVLASILKRMDSGAEEKILNQLSESDPDLGSDLRERLFTIDDIVNADDRFIQNKLQTMEDADVAYVIAGKSDAFRDKILSNVSTNRKNMILDEEDRRKPMRRADVEKATSLFFSAVRRAWEEGKLIIKGRDDEIYV